MAFPHRQRKKTPKRIVRCHLFRRFDIAQSLGFLEKLLQLKCAAVKTCKSAQKERKID
jgi:hypothetical protein